MEIILGNAGILLGDSEFTLTVFAGNDKWIRIWIEAEEKKKKENEPCLMVSTESHTFYTAIS